MLKKIIYFVVVIAIAVGAVISYKQVDFGNKTAILFKIVFGDQAQMMQMGPKGGPFPGGKVQGEFKAPQGFEGRNRGEFGPGRGEFRQGRGEFGNHRDPGFQGPPGGKGMHGKPGMGKTISLAKVIPYFFILSFFILATRVIDLAVRRVKK
jgi:hypothetical protein